MEKSYICSDDNRKMGEHNWYDISGNKAFLVCLFTYWGCVVYCMITGKISGFPIVELVLGCGVFTYLMSAVVASLAMKIFKIPKDIIEYIVCVACMLFVFAIIYLIYLLVYYILTLIPGTIQYNKTDLISMII